MKLFASGLVSALLLVGAVSAQGSSNRSGTRVPSLIDPRTRFTNQVILPDQGFPGLHRNWDPPLDSGEESYVGSRRLRGRKALITGGDSGIGRAVAIAYAREGADVTINYLPEEQPDADEVRALVEREGVRFHAIPGNLRNESFCASLVHRAHRAMGGLDILVSNAGYFVTHFNISTLTTEQLLRTFEVNVFASFYLVRAAAPLMPPGSSILFTSSGMARRPHAAAVDYAATKAALISMAQTLGLQLGPQGIRVNAVAPGLTASNFLTSHGLTTENATYITSQLPLGRIAQPAELAPIYVMLAEGSSSQSLASAYGVNGGNLSL
ncbi:NAD(P)-binding protein [Parathielavia hyrcaniae]|uniref:NAD(P)-binding protein n=1 Tax=Parathielavia hyrcaniae TaxID=113614 RepID=A0AAN6PWJ7_9PEZI|nr:NAD(P)-binding protein [Parathielavia hyrcaniae]